MVDYSPLGDCIFNEVFVISVTVPSPDAFPPFFFFRDIYIQLEIHFFFQGKKWLIAAQRIRDKKNHTPRYY